MTGFSKPNYTQTPNELFDILMAQMTEAELRVVLVAVRKTLGYHRDYDAISLTQFENMSGLSRQAVIDGIEAAKERGLLRELDERGVRGVKFYELVILGDQSTEATSTGQPIRPVDPPTSQRSRHTKEKTPKKKEKEKEIPPDGENADSQGPDPEKPLTEKQAARIALNAAVLALFEVKDLAYAELSNWGNFLTGQVPEKNASGKRMGKWFDYQMQPGMTLDEITAFHAWYRLENKKKVAAYCDHINLEVNRFRAAPAHDQMVERARLNREALEDLAARGGDQDDPEPEDDAPPMSEEQRQEVQSRLKALQAKMGGGK